MYTCKQERAFFFSKNYIFRFDTLWGVFFIYKIKVNMIRRLSNKAIELKLKDIEKGRVMISQVIGANIRNSYADSVGDKKEVSQKSGANVSKQGDTGKVDQIKEALESGEYKINLEALSRKIADELM